jgi:hypothetical protein
MTDDAAWALAADGAAKDPQAFQNALKQDVAKMAELQQVCVVPKETQPACW